MKNILYDEREAVNRVIRTQSVVDTLLNTLYSLLLFLGESIVLYSVYQTHCNLVLQVKDGKSLESNPESVKPEKMAAVP